MTGRRAALVLPPNVSAPRLARRFAAATLEEWSSPALVERVQLLVSELVTNAFLHARTGSHLLLIEDGACLRIEVADRGEGGAERQKPAVDAVGGRGLMLVEAVADRWGASHDGRTHVVWCELAK